MKTFKELPILIKIILIAIVAILLYMLIRGAVIRYKKYMAEQRLKDASASYTAGGATISVNFGSIAQQVYDAFYNNDIFGFSEDEEKAIIAISNTPKALIPQLKQTYFDLYAKNLNEDCIKYLGSDYSRVQNLLN